MTSSTRNVPCGYLAATRRATSYGDARLADTGRADERHQPVSAGLVDQPGDLLVAPDQSLDLCRQRRRHAPRREVVGGGALAGRDGDPGDELVTLAVDGPDDPLRRTVVADRLPGSLDPGRQRRLADEAVTPHCVEQLLLAHHRATPLDQAAEEIEHLRLEPHLPPLATQHNPADVQLAPFEQVDQPVRPPTDQSVSGIQHAR